MGEMESSAFRLVVTKVMKVKHAREMGEIKISVNQIMREVSRCWELEVKSIQILIMWSRKGCREMQWR